MTPSFGVKVSKHSASPGVEERGAEESIPKMKDYVEKKKLG
jgi:hypothetical protein